MAAQAQEEMGKQKAYEPATQPEGSPGGGGGPAGGKMVLLHISLQ